MFNAWHLLVTLCLQCGINISLHHRLSVSLLSADPTWPVVVGGVPAPCRQTVVGGRRGAQSRDHLHHVRQHHVTRADGPAALQHRAVRLLLYVQVWFYRHRPPATHRVYGDLLILWAEGVGYGGLSTYLINIQIIQGDALVTIMFLKSELLIPICLSFQGTINDLIHKHFLFH